MTEKEVHTEVEQNVFEQMTVVPEGDVYAEFVFRIEGCSEQLTLEIEGTLNKEHFDKLLKDDNLITSMRIGSKQLGQTMKNIPAAAQCTASRGYTMTEGEHHRYPTRNEE